MISRKIRVALGLALFLAALLPAAKAQALMYTIKSGVNLRQGPGLNHASLARLDFNQTLRPDRQEGSWWKVSTLTGLEGWIRQDMVSDVWIKVHKKERRLLVIQGDRVIRTYQAALCPANPLGDKEKQGDGGTPEGRFFICERIKQPGQAKYGARSLRISYPNAEDARRGLAGGLITYAQYLGLIKNLKAGRMPAQNTPLGGSIRIHGGGSDRDWTLGCVALSDRDVTELFDLVPGPARVEIYKSEADDQRINQAGNLSRLVLAGAEKQLENPALYTSAAAGLFQLSYPGGDIASDQAVCTDVIIRALRLAGLDLQALVHEDAVLNPDSYKRWIKKPSYHIDHRRVRNLAVFLGRHAAPVKDAGACRPGDLVIMDTGISNGTELDHIGIVSAEKDGRGVYRVINIWTVGFRTMAMVLLEQGYPQAVSFHRLTHEFDYQ